MDASGKPLLSVYRKVCFFLFSIETSLQHIIFFFSTEVESERSVASLQGGGIQVANTLREEGKGGIFQFEDSRESGGAGRRGLRV